MSHIRTLIVDDHETMRRILRAVLDGYFELEIAGEAGNGEEALQEVRRLQPDLVIMDISMPLLDGLSAAELIKKFQPKTQILIFSMHYVKEFVEAAKRLELNGFVSKLQGGTGLLEAVDAVVHGRKYFPPEGSAVGIH
jgi:two-component system nitrate/nitrite response regulator NarL